MIFEVARVFVAVVLAVSAEAFGGRRPQHWPHRRGSADDGSFSGPDALVLVSLIGSRVATGSTIRGASSHALRSRL